MFSLRFQSDGNVLALAYDRDVERFLGEVVLSRQANYDQYWRVWVNHDYQKDGKCSVLRDYDIEHYDCNALLPFMCEHGAYPVLLRCVSFFILAKGWFISKERLGCQ